jgi:hypothetical protein
VTDFFRVSRFLGGCDSQGGRLASMASPEASFDTPNQDCCHFKACLHSVEEIAELMATQEDWTQCQVETKRMAESPTADTLESCHRLKRVCLETFLIDCTFDWCRTNSEKGYYLGPDQVRCEKGRDHWHFAHLQKCGRIFLEECH